jgi:uncharacterized protein (TIGR00255 family)
MTGFGRATASDQNFQITCEIKSLNSRFLECFVKLPRRYSMFEQQIVSNVKSSLQRGKVDVFFEIKPTANSELGTESLDLDRAAQVLKALSSLTPLMTEHLGKDVERSIDPVKLLQYDGVFSINSSNNETTREAIKPLLMESLNEALKTLQKERQREGAALQTALANYLATLREDASNIRSNTQGARENLVEHYRIKIQELIMGLMEKGLDELEDRIILEAGVLADKIDIEEELIRLEHHIHEFSQCLQSQEPVGRKLDFLCQELHREINTITSKTPIIESLKCAVTTKQTIEQLRQQVQNIE